MSEQAVESSSADIGLLPPQLVVKSPSERFTAGEEALLAVFVFSAWERVMAEVGVGMAVVNRLSDCVEVDEYSWGVPEISWNKNGENLLKQVRSEGYPLFGEMRAQTIEDAFVVGAISQLSGARDVVLALGDIPLQKNERETRNPKRKGALELPLLRRSVDLIVTDNLRAVVLVDSHSFVTAMEFMRRGVAVADLTAIPGMVQFARREGLLNGESCGVVVDTGAMSIGKYMEEELGLKDGVQADKNFTSSTRSVYPIEQWEVVKGREVLFIDDRLMTFGTGSEPIRRALENKAESVVFLVTYPEFVGSALDRFRELRGTYGDRVTIVTTDLHNPDVDISNEPGIHVVEMQKRLRDVLELVRGGVNIMSQEGEVELLPLGFGLSPRLKYSQGSV